MFSVVMKPQALTQAIAITITADKRMQYRSKGLPDRRCLASSLVGCLTYYLLYFSKSLFYDNMLVGGLPFAAAALLLPLKIPASLFNAAAAIAAAPPLCLAIRAALRRAHLRLE